MNGMILSTKFRFIWPIGYRGEDSLEINKSETRIAKFRFIWQVLSEPEEKIF
jgi:hypothetical protein